MDAFHGVPIHGINRNVWLFSQVLQMELVDGEIMALMHQNFQLH